jgi:hypothetical protein
LEILREQGHQGASTSPKKLPHTPVAVALKEGHAAWVIVRESLSAPGNETEAKTLDVVEARILKLLDPHTEREPPNAEAIVEGRFFELPSNGAVGVIYFALSEGEN